MRRETLAAPKSEKRAERGIDKEAATDRRGRGGPGELLDRARERRHGGGRDMRETRGSAEDLGAPDSWELADLEESVNRLILSSKNDSAPSSSTLPDFPLPDSIDGSADSSSVSASGGGCGVGFSEDAYSQLDPFLKEALQNPRERLSVTFELSIISSSSPSFAMLTPTYWKFRSPLVSCCCHSITTSCIAALIPE
ncbi:hypothetical protein ACLOJK_020699 [Asimina triloba]